MQSQIEELRDLQRLTEEDRSKESARSDMIESLSSTVATLEAELAEKTETLKREKDANYELMDKLSESQERMDVFVAELKEARTSGSKQRLRNDDRVEQLEATIIDLNHQIKEHHDNMAKAKSVIRVLRNENREIEDELGGLHLEMERDTETRMAQRRSSIQRINEVVHTLGGSDLSDDEEIAQKLSDLAQNVTMNESRWREKEMGYKKDIDRLLREQREMSGTLKAAVQSKMHSLSRFNEQMEQLRGVVKAQEIH